METNNTKKNTGGVTGKGFDVNGQPAPEAKKRGWDIKRAKEAKENELWEIILETTGRSYAKAKAFKEAVEEHPENYTIDEVMMAQLLSNPKYYNQYLDRVMGKPTQKMDIKADVSIDSVIEKLKAEDEVNFTLQDQEQTGEDNEVQTEQGTD